MKWTRCGENLVRHPGGTIYLRAKIAGEKVRISLETTDLKAAKRKRDEKLEAMRHAATLGDQNIKTLGEALTLEKQFTMGKPKLKRRTKDYYAYLFQKIEATFPASRRADNWTAEDARQWWADHCEANHAPIHANNALAIVRRMMRTIVERGIRRDDPTKGIKRLKVPKTRIDDLPTLEQMETLLASIRTQKLRHSEEAAQMVEFLMWSGMRIGELQALRWEDIKDPWITVTGGAKGTKNSEIRQIPQNPRLCAILSARRWEKASGPVFHIVTPRIALENACERTGIRHMRIHDLRHWFASYCLSQGIDIPTVAAWLGHKDGGRTLLATYSHHQKSHSLASAGRLGIA